MPSSKNSTRRRASSRNSDKYQKRDCRWGLDRPANPCRVFALNRATPLVEQIRYVLNTCDEPIAVWLPERLEIEAPKEVDGVPIKCTPYNLGGSEGIWIEVGERPIGE